MRSLIPLLMVALTACDVGSVASDPIRLLDTPSSAVGLGGAVAMDRESNGGLGRWSVESDDGLVTVGVGSSGSSKWLLFEPMAAGTYAFALDNGEERIEGEVTFVEPARFVVVPDGGFPPWLDVELPPHTTWPGGLINVLVDENGQPLVGRGTFVHPISEIRTTVYGPVEVPWEAISGDRIVAEEGLDLPTGTFVERFPDDHEGGWTVRVDQNADGVLFWLEDEDGTPVAIGDGYERFPLALTDGVHDGTASFSEEAVCQQFTPDPTGPSQRFTVCRETVCTEVELRGSLPEGGPCTSLLETGCSSSGYRAFAVGFPWLAAFFFLARRGDSATRRKPAAGGGGRWCEPSGLVRPGARRADDVRSEMGS